MPLPDWSWGWRNRFYSIGVFCRVVGKKKKEEEEEGEDGEEEDSGPVVFVYVLIDQASIS